MSSAWPVLLGVSGQPLWFERFVLWTAMAIEGAGIGALVLGILIATVRFVIRLRAKQEFTAVYHRYRAEIGRAILLGLEFLVAADIIATVTVDPSFESVGVLAAIVVIRTFLSFSLETEIEGHWPWRASEKENRPAVR